MQCDTSRWKLHRKAILFLTLQGIHRPNHGRKSLHQEPFTKLGAQMTRHHELMTGTAYTGSTLSAKIAPGAGIRAIPFMTSLAPSSKRQPMQTRAKMHELSGTANLHLKCPAPFALETCSTFRPWRRSRLTGHSSH